MSMADTWRVEVHVVCTDHSGVFGKLPGDKCACLHLRNGEFGSSDVSEKRK